MDDELYNPQQVTTRDGHLVIRLDAIHSDGDGSSTLAAGVLRRRSPFCMGGGFIEIRAVLPEKQNHTLVFVSIHTFITPYKTHKYVLSLTVVGGLDDR